MRLTREQGVVRSAWQPMALRWVGDVGLVMTRKSGLKRDSFLHRAKKRRHGH